MQIEQSFRDLKCDRFGCAFYYSLTRKPERIAMLLLIHALATFVAWLAALSQHAVMALTQYGGIISQRRSRPHYSLLRIGWEALRRNDSAYASQSLLSTFLSPDGLDNHQFDAHRVRSGGGVHLKIPIDLI